MSSEGPIDRLLRGINTANLELMHGAFAADAEIVDDAKSFTGDNIRAFLDIAMIQHHANIRVVERQLQDDGRTYLHIMMDGDFVEGFGIHEPFDLYLVFHVVGDKIHRLDMGDVDPNKPTMRCVYGAGADMNDPLASLRIAPRNLPEPREGWVRVQMQAVGLNFHDIFTLRGISLHKLRFPLILGNEGAGILDDGTEVALYPTLGSPDFKDDETLDPDRSVLGELAPGTLAEYVMVPKRNAVPRPKEVSAQSAAVLGIAWLTAYRMLFTRAHLRAGQVMLVQGSSGGVTTALIQMGSAAGYRVWATGRTEVKRRLASQLGAERTFGPGQKLPQLVDAVFDTSGAATIGHSIESVKPGGAIVLCGVHSEGGSAEAKIDLLRLLTQQITLTGVYAGTLQEFRDMISFLAAKGVVPYVGKVLKLEDAGEGLRDIWEGRTDGKIVVQI